MHTHENAENTHMCPWAILNTTSGRGVTWKCGTGKWRTMGRMVRIIFTYYECHVATSCCRLHNIFLWISVQTYSSVHSCLLLEQNDQRRVKAIESGVGLDSAGCLLHSLILHHRCWAVTRHARDMHGIRQSRKQPQNDKSTGSCREMGKQHRLIAYFLVNICAKSCYSTVLQWLLKLQVKCFWDTV